MLQEWFRYFQHPQKFHTDGEGVFDSEEFKEFCGSKHIESIMCAGQAHWQNGIVERHIGTFRELFKKLSLDDRLECEDDQSVVDRVCWSKNHNGRYGGIQPSTMVFGLISSLN